MEKNISPEQYQAEIDSLNIKIEQLENKIKESAFKDPKNPFENPTEYLHYNKDYRETEPQLNTPFYKMPLKPEYHEKYNLKRIYNLTGLQIIFHIIASNLIMYILSMIIMMALRKTNPEANYYFLSNYFSTTLLAPANMITFLICNTLFALTGLKITKTKPSELFETCNFTIIKAICYCLIAFMIQHFTSIISSVISDIIGQYGFTMYTNPDNSHFTSTSSSIVIMFYSLLIAPVTEEFLYRGMLLKNLSRSSQRCGIFISALLFGLMHGTIPQIILGFASGIFLAHITIKHNSIIPAIIVHIFNNSLSYIMNPLYNIKSETGLFITNFIIAFTIMLGILAFLRFKLTNSIPHDTPHQSKRGIRLVFQSITIIMAIIYYITVTLRKILH